MGITDKFKLIQDRGIHPQDIDPQYTVIGLVLLIAAIFSLVRGYFITYLIGAGLLYAAVYVIFESYQPMENEDE